MQRTAVAILTLILALLALSGGGIFPWTLRLSAILLPASALLTLWHLQKTDPPTPLHSRLSPITLLFAFTLLMLIPLPASIHQIAPRRAEAHSIANQSIANIHAASQEQPLPSTRPYSLSRSRTGTIRFFLLCSAGFAAFLLMRATPDPLRRTWLISLLLLASSIAISGILGKWIIPQGDTILWFLPVPHGRPGPMGCFMNRNHFAGFLALLAPAALALALHCLQRKKPLASAGLLAIFAILSAGVLLSLSRGGTLALLAGTGTVAILFIRHAPRKYACLLLIMLIALASAASLAAWQLPQLRERFDLRSPATLSSLHERTAAWRDSLRIARAYPILGAGHNAFRAVYPQHRLTSDRASRDFAENEYIQWIAETGLAGLLIALAIAWPIIRRSSYLLLRQQPSETQPFALATAATGAIAAAATHAFFDFPLRLPIYALTLAAVAAMLWPSAPPPLALPPRIHTRTLAAAWLVAILLSAANLRLDAPRSIVAADLPTTIKALQSAPTHPAIWRRLAAILWQQNSEPTRLLSEQLLSQAAAYDPNNYVLWRTLGERRQSLGQNAAANDAYQRVRALRDWQNVPTLPEEEDP